MYLFLNAVVQEKKSWRESKETLDPSESLESCPMSLLQANPQGRKRMWRWTTEAPERERTRIPMLRYGPGQWQAPRVLYNQHAVQAGEKSCMGLGWWVWGGLTELPELPPPRRVSWLGRKECGPRNPCIWGPDGTRALSGDPGMGK